MMRMAMLPLLVSAAAAFASAPFGRQRAPSSRTVPDSTVSLPGAFRARTTTALRMTAQREGTEKDYYSVLGVPKNAGADEIQIAYRILARRYHPDANIDEDTMAKFREIRFAYDVLIDPERKKKYDDDGVRMPAESEDDIGDAFDAFFGGTTGKGDGKRGRTLGRGPVAGYYQVDLEVDSKTAVLGGKEPVQIRRFRKCQTCGGTGHNTVKCRACGGTGATRQVDGFAGQESFRTCAACKGTGHVEEVCATCAGQGRTPEINEVKVIVPPGVEDGDVLHVSGGNSTRPDGSPAGDFYVFLKVKDDGNSLQEDPETNSDTSGSQVIPDLVFVWDTSVSR